MGVGREGGGLGDTAISFTLYLKACIRNDTISFTTKTNAMFHSNENQAKINQPMIRLSEK
jgi:hypothetical protein